jgi:hypothetical protein
VLFTKDDGEVMILKDDAGNVIVQQCSSCGGMFNDAAMHECGELGGISLKTHIGSSCPPETPVDMAKKVKAFIDELSLSPTKDEDGLDLTYESCIELTKLCIPYILGRS